MVLQDSIISDEMRQLIGKEMPAVNSEEPVTKTDIRRFAQALLDQSMVYFDEAIARESKFGGIVAPGPFPATYGTHAHPYDVPDPMLNHAPDWNGNEAAPVDEGPRVKWPEGFITTHGGDEIEVRQLARPGERISSVVRYSEFREREGSTGRLGIAVRETVFMNDKGEILCINRNESVARQIRR